MCSVVYDVAAVVAFSFLLVFFCFFSSSIHICTYEGIRIACVTIYMHMYIDSGKGHNTDLATALHSFRALLHSSSVIAYLLICEPLRRETPSHPSTHSSLPLRGKENLPSHFLTCEPLRRETPSHPSMHSSLPLVGKKILAAHLLMPLYLSRSLSLDL